MKLITVVYMLVILMIILIILLMALCKAAWDRSEEVQEYDGEPGEESMQEGLQG